MCNDIRLRTKLVLRRDNRFLVGRNCYGSIIWSQSVYDAWNTRIRADAIRLARRLGADIYLFNSITGEIRKLEGMNHVC